MCLDRTASRPMFNLRCFISRGCTSYCARAASKQAHKPRSGCTPASCPEPGHIAKPTIRRVAVAEYRAPHGAFGRIGRPAEAVRFRERKTMSRADEKPPITISAPDYDRLERIAHAGRHTRRPPPSAPILSAELERANVVPAAEVGDKVVAMHSTLTFRDDATGEVRRVTLVYPGEEDIAFG